MNLSIHKNTKFISPTPHIGKANFIIEFILYPILLIINFLIEILKHNIIAIESPIIQPITIPSSPNPSSSNNIAPAFLINKYMNFINDSSTNNCNAWILEIRVGNNIDSATEIDSRYNRFVRLLLLTRYKDIVVDNKKNIDPKIIELIIVIINNLINISYATFFLFWAIAWVINFGIA